MPDIIKCHRRVRVCNETLGGGKWSVSSLEAAPLCLFSRSAAIRYTRRGRGSAHSLIVDPKFIAESTKPTRFGFVTSETPATLNQASTVLGNCAFGRDIFRTSCFWWRAGAHPRKAEHRSNEDHHRENEEIKVVAGALLEPIVSLQRSSYADRRNMRMT